MDDGADVGVYQHHLGAQLPQNKHHITDHRCQTAVKKLCLNV